jgi:hypothetical protein
MQLYDQYGNPNQILDRIAGETLIDSRPNSQIITALGSEVILYCAGEKTAIAQIIITGTATLIAEATIDGINYFNIPMFNPITEMYITSMSVTGQIIIDIPSASMAIRLKSTAISGQANVFLRATKAASFVIAKDIPSTGSVSVISSMGASITLTIPASSTLFNYLTRLEIVKFAGALLTAGASPISVSLNGISGTPFLSFSASADQMGTSEVKILETKIKGSGINTPISIGLPATPNIIWRATAFYYVGL